MHGSINHKDLLLSCVSISEGFSHGEMIVWIEKMKRYNNCRCNSSAKALPLDLDGYLILCPRTSTGQRSKNSAMTELTSFFSAYLYR